MDLIASIYITCASIGAVVGVLLGWGNEKAGGPIEGAAQCACAGLGVAFLIHLFSSSY